MADAYRNLTTAQKAMTPLQRILAGTYQMVPYDAGTNMGMYEDGHRLLFDAMMADIAAVQGQMGTLAASILAGANAPRTVVFLTSATFYESGNVAGDYAQGQAVVLAQTSPGSGYVLSATYDSGNGYTVIEVEDVTVDSGLTQCVLGVDPAYAPKSGTSPVMSMFWASGGW